MKVGKSAETYQVGAHFKALIKAILVAPSRTLEKFFSFHVSLPRCDFLHTSDGKQMLISAAIEVAEKADDTQRKTNSLFALLKVVLLSCVIDTE